MMLELRKDKMIQTKIKPCKYCGGLTHQSWRCKDRPKKKSTKNTNDNKFGKDFTKWRETKNEWMQKNPPTDGYWYCHYCGTSLVADFNAGAMGGSVLTLDHIENKGNPASRHLKFDISNLVACCMVDNQLKGSMSYEKFCTKFYPELLAGTADQG